MESRVGSLALQVRAPAERLDALGPAAEAFTVRILGRCDELLEGQSPGRVILVHQLDLSLRLVESALDHEGEQEAFAEEIAETIDAWARSAGEVPSGTPEIAVFEDELAWRAAHLEARATGRSERGWCFDALEADNEPTRTLVEGGPTPQLHALLARLRRRGTLRPCLTALPAAVIDTLARMLESPAETGQLHHVAAPDQPQEVVAACLDDLPISTPLSLVRVCLAVTARDLLGPSAPEVEIAKTARAALARFLAISSATLAHAAGVGVGEVGITSKFGGLFFLLNPALEISIADTLWRACLPEGLILAHAAGALLGGGADDDPAPALFGGSSGDLLPEVSPEQQAEVSLSLLSAIRDALPRRGMAELPELLLRLVETPAGRMLAAAEPSSPYALFAFPARSPDEMRLALDAFLGVWPASAPPARAARALAELDRRARVRPVKSTPPAANLLVAQGSSLLSCALITQIAGSLGHLFAARAGISHPISPTDIVARYLSLPARVVLADKTMEIQIPMTHLALDVRRAGLDANPGWVPWLGRRVTFTYEEDVPIPDESMREA